MTADSRNLDVSLADTIPELREQLEGIDTRLAEVESERTRLNEERARVLVVLEWVAARIAATTPSDANTPGTSAETDTLERRPGTSVTSTAESSGRGTIPQRVLVLVDAEPDHTWTIRELTDQLFGEGATRSHLETVRKSTLRLVERGTLGRVDTKHFQALAEVLRN